jgi:hypothetical protein
VLKAEQPKLRAARLVFIDETAVTTKMVRHYRRSPRGERLVSGVPHGHWRTLTLVAALRIDGLTAPYVVDADYAQGRHRHHGRLVHSQDCRCPRGDRGYRRPRALSAGLHSPDLNPIEQAFSRLNAALRKGAARTVHALHKLIGKLIKSFAPKICANYFSTLGMPDTPSDPHHMENAIVLKIMQNEGRGRSLNR